MTPAEGLRLAVALAHSAGGARLLLRCHGGDRVVIGPHPAADLDACAMRKVVIASARPGADDHTARVEAVEIGGSLIPIGGGLYRRVDDGTEQRWFATLLAPGCVGNVLRERASASFHARLVPDPGLGVTSVVVTATDAGGAARLDAAAADALAACLVEELLHTIDRHPDTSTITRRNHS